MLRLVFYRRLVIIYHLLISIWLLLIIWVGAIIIWALTWLKNLLLNCLWYFVILLRLCLWLFSLNIVFLLRNNFFTFPNSFCNRLMNKWYKRCISNKIFWWCSCCSRSRTFTIQCWCTILKLTLTFALSSIKYIILIHLLCYFSRIWILIMRIKYMMLIR